MVHFTAKPFVAGAFAMLLGGTMLSTSAYAGKCILVGEDSEDDGSTTELWKDTEDGHLFIIMISADGEYSLYDPPGDPNPEDGTTGPGSHSDKPDVVKLIELGAATYKVHIAPADSPDLMGHLQGLQGLGPRYNPSDDDNGNGPGAAPTGGSMDVKKTQAEIRLQIVVANIIANERATLESSMGDGDEGSGEGPAGFNKNGSPGGTGNDDGDYTEGQNKTIGKTEKDLLGAKPELVNPPHWGNDLATHGGGRTSTGGGNNTGGGSLGGGAHNATSTHG